MQLTGHHISAKRGNEILFHHLNLSISAGQLLTVTGTNGSGKTTLLRIISGLLQPDQGKICLSDKNQEYSIGANCHYLSTVNAMKSDINVLDNLKFWAQFQQQIMGKPEQILKRVGLEGLEHLPYAVLSTGQKRRLAIARLLISFRPLWILDEPTSGLDEQSTILFSTFLREHLDNSGIIVAATHLPLKIIPSQTIAINDYTPVWEDIE